MMSEDLNTAKQQVLLRDHGFNTLGSIPEK
ncbi:MAG: hypothetical protein CM15mP29_3570 [Alphaproteobacteria bacterium]|nr:MAG: hypothetical protein CM15mP29_3570 [Alphaproteobacteria bacterium]